MYIVCIFIYFRFVKLIEVGSFNEEIEISIIVRNDGKLVKDGNLVEDAYETMFYVEFSEGVLYSGIINVNVVW